MLEGGEQTQTCDRLVTFPKKEDDCLSFSGEGGLDGVLAVRLPPPSRTCPELDLGRPGVPVSPVLGNTNSQEYCRALGFD